jgi:hypothetical protein
MAWLGRALERTADREAKRLRIEILGSISHAPGVTQVRDHVRIDPYF